MVDLNVVAVDNHGDPVYDLTRDELRVTDSGRPETIAFFHLRAAGTPRVLQPWREQHPARHTDSFRPVERELQHAGNGCKPADSQPRIPGNIGLRLPVSIDSRWALVPGPWLAPAGRSQSSGGYPLDPADQTLDGGRAARGAAEPSGRYRRGRSRPNNLFRAERDRRRTIQGARAQEHRLDHGWGANRIGSEPLGYRRLCGLHPVAAPDER